MSTSSVVRYDPGKCGAKILRIASRIEEFENFGGPGDRDHVNRRTVGGMGVWISDLAEGSSEQEVQTGLVGKQE